MYGKGRVFYSTLGHTEEAWNDPDIRKMYFEAIKWVLGMTEGSTTSHARPQTTGGNAETTRMNVLRGFWFWIACAVLVGGTLSSAQNPSQNTQAGSESKQKGAPGSKTYSPELIQKGTALFRQDCSFCHGRDAGGGESGPDLTRSKLVIADIDGDKIGPVVRNGRPDKGMPPFDRSEEQIASVVAFIHTQQKNAVAASSGPKGSGGRKGVDVSDLQTGNVQAGKQYFEGAGGCAKCHSAAGDLAGVATRSRAWNSKSRCSIPNTRNQKSA